MKTHIKTLAFLFITLFFINTSTQLWAQELTKTQLNEMVVTSTMTKHDIMVVPSNVMVITADDIGQMDAKTMAEVLKKYPGIFYSSASGIEPHLSLRGTRIGMSGGALVLLNGIPMNMGKFGYTDFEAIPVENIERIEVVKGPLSALYGGDSARGVINIVTKKGKKPVQGCISTIVGSYKEQRYSATLYGSQKKLFYNLNMKKREQETFRDYTSLDGYYLNGEIGYWLGDFGKISFFGNAIDKKRLLPKALTKEDERRSRSHSPDYSETYNRDYISGINLDINRPKFDIRSTLYYKTRDKNYENYKLATRYPYKEELNEYTHGIRSVFTYKTDIFQRKSLSSIGFDFDNDEIHIDRIKAAQKEIGAPYIKPDPKKSGKFRRREIGIFFQQEFELLKNLNLVAGVRYDYFEFDLDPDYDFSEGGTKNFDDSPDFDKLNPRVSLNYTILKNLTTYVSFSKAYRAPNIYDYYYSSSYAVKYQYTLKPETFTQYEAGIRYAFSKYLNIDTSVYWIGIDDMLDTVYDDSGHYMGKQNVSEVTIKGIDLSLFGKFSSRINYKVNYTYTDARYTDHLLAKVGRRQVVDVKDNRLTKVPYNKLSIDLNTKILKGRDYELLWYVNFYAQTGFQMDKANTKQYPGYGLVNTKLTLKYKKANIFIAADNLLDKEYDAYAYRSYGKDYYYPASGITVSAGLQFYF